MRNKKDITRELMDKYTQFNIDWEGNTDHVGIMKEVYNLLIELKEQDPDIARSEARRIIQMSNTWTMSDRFIELKNEWDKMVDLFRMI